MGNLVFQATLGGQVNLVGPNTASTYNINVPALSGTMASIASVNNNGVVYVNSSGQPTTGSALVFDAANTALSVGGAALGTAANRTVFTLNATTSNFLSFGIGGTRVAHFYSDANEFAIANAAGSSGFITLQTNGSERVRLDSSGNLGLGVTPSAWYSTYKAFQIGIGGALFGRTATQDQVNISANYYVNASNADTYINNGYATLYKQNAGQHQFYTAANNTNGANYALGTFTQAMTLDASGNLLVGQNSLSSTTAGVSFSGTGYSGGAGYVQTAVAASTNAATTMQVYSTGAGAFRFYVDMGGTVHATSMVITAISDERLKENIRDLDTGLSTVMALKPRRYDWKEGKGLDKKNAAGFIAQEFEEVFPASVGTTKAGEDGIEYKNINYEELIPTLVKAIQELETRLAALEAK